MIGPHEGKELALMLAGKKPLAVFHDLLTPGLEISEEIIPEEAFGPSVKAGKIIRHSKDLRTGRSGDVIRYVLFALPDEVWRIKTYLWLTEEIFAGRYPADEACEVFTGRLLGYSEEDIAHFLQHRSWIQKTYK